MARRARGHAGGGLARARALEHVAHVGMAVLLQAGEVSVPGPRQVHLVHLGVDRPWVHPLLPVGVVAVVDSQRHGAAQGVAPVAHPRGHLGAVGLDLHAPAAPVPELCAGPGPGRYPRAPARAPRAAPRDRGQAGPWDSPAVVKRGALALPAYCALRLSRSASRGAPSCSSAASSGRSAASDRPCSSRTAGAGGSAPGLERLAGVERVDVGEGVVRVGENVARAVVDGLLDPVVGAADLVLVRSARHGRGRPCRPRPGRRRGSGRSARPLLRQGPRRPGSRCSGKLRLLGLEVRQAVVLGDHQSLDELSCWARRSC